MELNVRIKLVLVHKLEVQSKKQNKHGKTKRFLKQYMTERFLFYLNWVVTLLH